MVSQNVTVREGVNKSRKKIMFIKEKVIKVGFVLGVPTVLCEGGGEGQISWYIPKKILGKSKSFRCGSSGVFLINGKNPQGRGGFHNRPPPPVL